MQLALMTAESQGATQFFVSQESLSKVLMPLENSELFAGIVDDCAWQCFDEAAARAAAHRKQDPYVALVASWYIYAAKTCRAGSQTRKVISVDLGEIRLAILGEEGTTFFAGKIGKALNQLIGPLPRELALSRRAPIYGGEIEGPQFRKLVKVIEETGDNIVNANLLITSLVAAGATRFLVQPG